MQIADTAALLAVLQIRAGRVTTAVDVRFAGTIAGLSAFRGSHLPKGIPNMCDYSLQNVSSRPATVGDQLVTRDFRTGTRGFADVETPSVAICLLPGTEIAFPEGLPVARRILFGWRRKPVRHYTAIFRQINKQVLNVHHDALEFPDGDVMLLTTIAAGQKATVLQLPARPKSPAEAESQRRVAYAG